jgi:1,4-dihydroxy-2-naphthoyl-CoA hydrolase
VLAICHEAYEASLSAAGIDLKEFFRGVAIAIPITHAEVDFYRPMFCGDRILVYLEAEQLSSQAFALGYRICAAESEIVLGKAHTKHVCIDPTNRSKTDLPTHIIQWLITIQPKSSVADRSHDAFLKSYASEDEGLY